MAVPGDPERLPGSVEPDDTKLGPNDGTNAPHSGSGGDAVAVTAVAVTVVAVTVEI